MVLFQLFVDCRCMTLQLWIQLSVWSKFLCRSCGRVADGFRVAYSQKWEATTSDFKNLYDIFGVLEN
jgi:hypothetical protein